MMLTDVTLAQTAERWLAHGLNCEPADRVAAEAGVRAAYELAGLAAPKLIVWLGSPAAGASAVGMLATGRQQPGPVLDLLLAQGARPGVTELGASVRPHVRTRPWAQARAALTARLGGIGFARHWAATAGRPWQQLVEQLATPLRTRLDAIFAEDDSVPGRASRAALLDVIFGQHDAAWLGAFDGDRPELAGLARVAESAGWWWAFEQVAVLTERPDAVNRDNLGRLHHGDGAALSYPDGFALHAWGGMPVPDDIVTELPTLTAGRITDEANAEMRRVMLEYYGFERYLRESGAAKQHTDECGTLWRIDLPGDEPLVMVEVVNASPEPDGTFRTYFLRVPPNTRTARAGVAWTFSLSESEYAPLQQT